MYDRAEDGHHAGHGHGHGHGGHWISLDMFRLTASFAFVFAVWIAFLMWVYIWDMPRGSLFPCMVVIIASIAMYRPEANHVHYGIAWVLGLQTDMGPPGLWWGLVAGLAAVAIILLLRVRARLSRHIRRVVRPAGFRQASHQAAYQAAHRAS